MASVGSLGFVGIAWNLYVRKNPTNIEKINEKKASNELLKQMSELVFAEKSFAQALAKSVEEETALIRQMWSTDKIEMQKKHKKEIDELIKINDEKDAIIDGHVLSMKKMRDHIEMLTEELEKKNKGWIVEIMANTYRLLISNLRVWKIQSARRRTAFRLLQQALVGS